MKEGLQNDWINGWKMNNICFYYVGEGPNDLSFVAGEKITIVNPSSQMFWYVARNRRDETGLVPITFLKV